jgi:hypothetical protein
MQLFEVTGLWFTQALKCQNESETVITFVATTGPHNDAAIEEFSSLKLRGSDLAELSVAELQEPEWSFLTYATKKRLVKFVDSLRNKKASHFNAPNYCECSEPNPYTSLTGECS